MDGVVVLMSAVVRLDGWVQIVQIVYHILDVLMEHVLNLGHVIVSLDTEESLARKNWTFVKRWTVIHVKMVEHVYR